MLRSFERSQSFCSKLLREGVIRLQSVWIRRIGYAERKTLAVLLESVPQGRVLPSENSQLGPHQDAGRLLS